MAGGAADAADAARKDPPRATRFGPPGPLEVALLTAAALAWGWLLWGLRYRPLEWGLLAAAVGPLAAVGLLAERLARRAWPPAGVVAMLAAGFGGLALATAVSPATLGAFALGIVVPAGWEGDHLLLRALPLVMLAAHPWRRTWPAAIVSALGVSAFLGIALMILDAAA